MYTQKIANIFDHIQDHSRLGLENKSGRIFCPRQVYFTNSCRQIWGCLNQPFIIFTAALKHGIRNPETEKETKRNTESNINGGKLKNFYHIA